MKRRLLALLACVCCLSTVGVLWLGASENGLILLARLAGAASGGRLVIAQPRGHLFGGELAAGQVRWQTPDLAIDIADLQLTWSPAALLQGRLAIAELSVERLRIEVAASAEASQPPASLALPLAIAVTKLQVAQFAFGPSLTIEQLQARYMGDSEAHRIEQLNARIGNAEFSGTLSLGALAPLPVEASGQLVGVLRETPVRLGFSARGPLARIALAVDAQAGLRGEGSATLTPFARRPLAEASLAFTEVDPAAWLRGAPGARLSLQASLQPEQRAADAFRGAFRLSNAAPGPLDRQRLPLATLSGKFAWRGDLLQLGDLQATLPGAGVLAGSGRWQGTSLDLELQARALDLARLAAVMRPTRLSGPLAASIGARRQALSCSLADTGFVLRLEASHEEGRLVVPHLDLAAGEATLKASGELQTAGGMAFAARGELASFDPSRWVQAPSARINASLSASGRLAPQPLVEARFALRDSRLGGQPLTGKGDLRIDWPRVPYLDIQVLAGVNRVSARGAFGRPGERLLLDLEAPQLAAYGFVGGLTGHLQLRGMPGQARLAADLRAKRFGLPGLGLVSDASLLAELGSTPDEPLQLELRAATLAGAEWPGLLRQLDLQVTGTQRQQRLQLAGEVAGPNRLQLSGEGGFVGELQQLRWVGRLLSARLDAERPTRSFVLGQAAPLRLGPDAWQVGPVVLDGDAWQLRGEVGSDGRRLLAAFSGRGPRIGRVNGQFAAAQPAAWALEHQAPWQGTARLEVADLGWVAEWLAEGWQTGGRLDGELALAGTPAQPLISGRLRGEQLALAAPELGMKLANGRLEASLADNLLRVRGLSFDSVLQALPHALRRSDEAVLAQLVAKPGRLEVSGEIRLAPGASAGSHGRLSDGAALDLRFDRVGVYQLPDQWLTVSGAGRISWIDDVFALRSQLAVDAAYWQLAPMGTPRLSDDVVIKRPARGKEVPTLRPRLDIDVETDLGQNFHFRGAGLSARLAGSVRVSAQGRDLPRASGRIRTRAGRFDAYGQQLEVERGILTFQGLLDNPAIDARAVRKGLPVEAGVQISGTAQKPLVRLVSDPELPEVEKLSWLVLGHGPEQGGAGDAAVLLGAAGSLLGNDSGGVMQQIKQGFGIDEFSMRQGQLGDSTGRQPGSRVVGGSFDATASTGNQILSVGRRLSNNALLSYEQTLGKAESVVKLTIALNRQLSVIARAGSDNAVDALYTITFGEPAPRLKRRPEWAGGNQSGP